MQVAQSLEVRWFFSADDPVAVELQSWFESAALENDGGREDLYYIDTERRDLNAKARGGDKPKLEYKYRIGGLDSMRLSSNVAGHVERWNKLSLPVDAELSKYPQIIAVRKTRKLRKFAFDVNGRTSKEVGAKEKPEAGCGVEVTMLRATRGLEVHEACSLGFEAFGPSPIEVEALLCVARLLFEERSEIELFARQSENYSSWLIRHFAP